MYYGVIVTLLVVLAAVIIGEYVTSVFEVEADAKQQLRLLGTSIAAIVALIIAVLTPFIQLTVKAWQKRKRQKSIIEAMLMELSLIEVELEKMLVWDNEMGRYGDGKTVPTNYFYGFSITRPAFNAASNQLYDMPEEVLRAMSLFEGKFQTYANAIEVCWRYPEGKVQDTYYFPSGSWITYPVNRLKTICGEYAAAISG